MHFRLVRTSWSISEYVPASEIGQGSVLDLEAYYLTAKRYAYAWHT